MEIENARISRTMLGIEDHGILTFMLYLDFASGGQGFGGWTLDDKPVGGKDRAGTDFGMECINRILRTLDVETWEKLPGTFCRVKRSGGYNSTIEAIGHPLKDRWFAPHELAAAMGIAS